MPWLTVHTHVTPEDVVIYEDLLDSIAQADRQARLAAAYGDPLHLANVDRTFIEEGWNHAHHDATPRRDSDD